jgi:hypothetical protein
MTMALVAAVLGSVRSCLPSGVPGRTQVGQAETVLYGLRARRCNWPPLRLVRLCCEHVSGSQVGALRLLVMSAPVVSCWQPRPENRPRPGHCSVVNRKLLCAPVCGRQLPWSAWSSSSGVAEIAELLGITHQGVDKLTRTRGDFPAPTAVLTAGRIWEREPVEQWARETGRIK